LAFPTTEHRTDGEVNKGTEFDLEVRSSLTYRSLPLTTPRDDGCFHEEPHEEPHVFWINDFSALQRDEKIFLVASCTSRAINRCLRNRPHDTHDIILIAEDALIKVSARLVLVANFSGRFHRKTIHVYHIAGLNIFRYEGLVRAGLDEAYFLRSQQNSTPFPGPISVFIRKDSSTSNWDKQTIDQRLSLDDVIREKAVKPTPTIQRSVLSSAQGILLTCRSDMPVYRLVCVCNTSTFCNPDHASIDSEHFYVRYSSEGYNHISGYMVVAEGQKMVLIKGVPERRDKIQLLGKDFQFWRIRIDYLRRFDIENSNNQMDGAAGEYEALKDYCSPMLFKYSLFWDSRTSEWRSYRGMRIQS
jgi:hypothetical protein